MIRVTIWNEYLGQKGNPEVEKVYPDGMHKAIADFLRCDDVVVRTATLEQPENGLPQALLDETDVLIWWGHMHHNEVSDETVERVQRRVLMGMGIIFLHSAHESKPMMRLLGTKCNLSWRESGDRARVWCVNPQHPIAKGLPPYFVIPTEETYGEFFDIPTPDELVFVTWYSGGEVFRGGCTWRRGYGKIFYFHPGHETFPTFHQPEVQQVLKNAVRWAAPETWRDAISCPCVEAPESKYKA